LNRNSERISRIKMIVVKYISDNVASYKFAKRIYSENK
jgi:hypothetical protein